MNLRSDCSTPKRGNPLTNDASMLEYLRCTKPVPKWRNWQTHLTQNQAPSKRAGSSPPRHQLKSKTIAPRWSFLCPGMAQSDKVNVLPQEVTAKYSNPQTGINGAKREEVVLQKRGTPFLFKSPRRRQNPLFSARGPAALRRTAQKVLFISLSFLAPLLF